MNVSQAVLWKYPNAYPLQDFRVDVINGIETIVAWHLQDPQPTDSDLQSWWLEYLRGNKHAELSNACESTIISGFTGTNGHSYQFDYKDQDNLTQQMLFIVNDATITSIQWKTKDAGIVTHTRDEFLQICQDANNFKRNQMGKYWQLESQLSAATTEDGITSIYW